MIFSNTSNYMLKYQKAKAKLVEYDIPQKDYPKFPLNSNELSYPVVYILSRYAESVIENNVVDMEEFSPHLVAASQYFDAAVGANDRAEYDVDFLLSGAASYFLSDDFGSAKVLCSEYFARINPEANMPQKIIGNLLGYLLLNRDFHISEDTPDGEKVCRSLLAYYNTGEGAEEIQSLLSEYRKAIYENDAPMEIYYVDILCAIVTVALSKSSWSLLPRYSGLDQSLWSDYLKSPKAPRMLWPAQQLIGEKGVLRGQNAIVQLPTGVGKTKSIELIIRSSFASDRATTAIIVAPLRALCNEIANDMIPAIKISVELLANRFGVAKTTPYETLYTFPTVLQLANADDQDLVECKLGYRVPYVKDAIIKVMSGSVDLVTISDLSNIEILDVLKTIRGVGDKVANCICLFSYGRIGVAPVDTWIYKIIAQEYDGVNPFPTYGEHAGIMQQYAFYYAISNKGRFANGSSRYIK